MKSKKQLYVLIFALMSMTLTGCHSLLQSVEKTVVGKKQKRELLTPLAQPLSGMDALTAKVSITADYDRYPISLRGRLRMRYDEVVQISVTALGVIEVAFIECTPQAAYIVDRINKQYARIDYSSGLPNSVGINFNTIQALFWNRLFIPGRERAWEYTSKFNLIPIESQLRIEPTIWSLLKCQFTTNSNCSQLQQTNLSLKDYASTWQYCRFQDIGGYVIPTMFDISVSHAAQSAEAQITLSDIAINNTTWKTGTNLSNYREVTMEQILSLLNTLK